MLRGAAASLGSESSHGVALEIGPEGAGGVVEGVSNSVISWLDDVGELVGSVASSSSVLPCDGVGDGFNDVCAGRVEVLLVASAGSEGSEGACDLGVIDARSVSGGSLVVGDEVLALVAGWSSVALGPLGGDGGAEDDVLVVGLSPVGLGLGFARGEGGGDPASIRSAWSSASGIARPRFPARLRMPDAALALKENLPAHASTSTSGKDEDTPPALGNSEESTVQDSVGEVVKPELGQRREKDGEISSTVTGKESGNVFDEDEASWSNKFIGAPRKLEEETGSVAGEAGASPGDG